MFYALFAIKHLIHSSPQCEEQLTDGSRWSFPVLCLIMVDGYQQQKVTGNLCNISSVEQQTSLISFERKKENYVI